jgi:hypothetical protein
VCGAQVKEGHLSYYEDEGHATSGRAPLKDFIPLVRFQLVEPTPVDDFKFQLVPRDESSLSFTSGLSPGGGGGGGGEDKLPESLNFRAADEISRKQWIA